MFAVKKSLLCLAVSLMSGAALAAPVTIDGFSPTTGNTVSGPAAAARINMVQYLNASVQTFTFESALAGDTAAQINPMTFTGGTSAINATMQGNGVVASGLTAGRYNTTSGAGLTAANGKYWQASAGGAGSGNVAGTFSIAFSRGISAFGFYATDIGDFEGQLTILLTPTAGGPDISYTPPQAVNPANGNNDLLFWGFYDLTATYSKVTFLTSGVSATADYFGFDDFFVADRSQLVTTTTPEPGSVALVGLALAAAAVVTRKRKLA